MKLYNQQGQPITLGEELGRGGEGRVFTVGNQPDLVAKVYDRAVPPEKAEKLSLMVSLATERLLRLAAWPTDTLHEAPGKQMAGFLMPRVNDHKPIHSLYGPKDRLHKFPQADWRFLIHAASNLAAAFAVVHEHGHIIGDVNHGNVVVSQQATVRLIDCDSFQIRGQIKRPINGPDRWFLCEVGVSTHTPPELQFKPLGETVRTVNHDNFGLAVLIFQLLFMGRHPFSGRFLGAGEMAMERAIQEFRFAYSSQAAAQQMEPPPNTLALSAGSEPVAQLFERAFSSNTVTGATRPTSQEWIAALSQLSARLIKCPKYSGHYFLDSLKNCPWCEIEARTGVLLFPLPAFQLADGGFNLATVWAQIKAVPQPGVLPVILPPQVEPSAQALKMRRRGKLNLLLSFSFLIAASAGLWYLSVGRCVKAGLVIVALYIGLRIAASGLVKARQELTKQHREAMAKWESLERTWKLEAGNERFQTLRRELERMKSEYEKLPATRQQKLKQLEKARRQHQLQRFLDGYLIRDAAISGIGATRKTALQSYGIETADDVTQQAVLAVPGFGPAYTARLVEWRQGLEKQFVFDAAKPVDPRDIAQVEQEMATTRAKLEQELAHGAMQLHQIRQQTLSRRQALQPAVEAALKNLAQLEADSRMM